MKSIEQFVDRLVAASSKGLTRGGITLRSLGTAKDPNTGKWTSRWIALVPQIPQSPTQSDHSQATDLRAQHPGPTAKLPKIENLDNYR